MRGSWVRVLLLACLWLPLAALAYSQPYIQDWSPASGSPGTKVTVTGSGFTGTTQVWVGGGHDAAFTVASDTSLTLTAPGDATTGQIAIVNPSYAAWSGSDFTVSGYPQPYIQGFSPASGAVGSKVTVTGSGFTGTSAVWVGSGHDAVYTVIDDGTLSLTVPADGTSGQIAIVNPQNTAWTGTGFTVTATPAPSISGLSPGSGPPGTKVAINGANLSGTTAVKFNGVASTQVTVVSSSSINAVVPASASSGAVTVTTPGGTATSPASFTVSPYPQPYIQNFNPASGVVGTKVTVTGSGFTGANAVWVGNGHDAAFTVTGDTTLTLTVPGDASTGQIAILNPSYGAWSGSAFTLNPPPPPTVSSFSPTTGAAGTAVTITGTGFTGVSGVSFNGTAASQYTVNSATSISATVPASATTGPITVASSHGSGSSASSFTVPGNNAPTITGISPTSGTEGTAITITGTNLSNATQATIGGVVEPNAVPSTFTQSSGTQTTVAVPQDPHIAPGAISVSITTPYGTATSPVQFTVVATPPAPTISSVSPASGAVGTTVTVTGTNLTGAAVGTFNGVPAAPPTSVTSTSLKLVVPAGANNGRVAVSTRGGTAYSPAAFTVTGSNNTPAALGNFTVASGGIKDGAGHSIQIRGVNMNGFNADVLVPEFLWAMSYKAQLDQIKALGFNAIRCPFVPLTLHTTNTVDSYHGVDFSINPDLQGKTPLQAMDLWMSYADSIGLYVVFDMHSLSNSQSYPVWFDSSGSYTYNGQPYSQTDWINDLVFLAKRYANVPHFLGIDLYNEPRDQATWTGQGNLASWQSAAEQAAAALLAANPNILIFVEGIDDQSSRENETIEQNWGENFQPENYSPLNIAANKLVLSPHTYGPDTYDKHSFDDPSFPSNLSADWNTLFGQFYPAHAVIPGEFGSHYGENDSGSNAVPYPKGIAWMNAFVNYLIGIGDTNGFLWDYTPNSGDTSGIIFADPFTGNDFGVRTDKMSVLLDLWRGTPVQ